MLQSETQVYLVRDPGPRGRYKCRSLIMRVRAGSWSPRGRSWGWRDVIVRGGRRESPLACPNHEFRFVIVTLASFMNSSQLMTPNPLPWPGSWGLGGCDLPVVATIHPTWTKGCLHSIPPIGCSSITSKTGSNGWEGAAAAKG